jgi:hypothetical protein
MDKFVRQVDPHGLKFLKVGRRSAQNVCTVADRMDSARHWWTWPHSARKDEVMFKAITRLIIASASLWLAVPAVAQFEIDPDHFDDPAPTVVQPRPEQSRGSMRTSLPHKQVQGHRVEAFEGTRGSANTPRKSSNGAAAQQHSVSRTGRFGQGSADRKRKEQSRLASSWSCTSSERMTSAYHGKHTHCGL